MLPETISVHANVLSSTILIQKMTEYTQKTIKNIDTTITTVMCL